MVLNIFLENKLLSKHTQFNGDLPKDPTLVSKEKHTHKPDHSILRQPEILITL